MPIGVFFRQEKPAYHREILGIRNPVTGRVAKAERQDTVNSLIIN
jgi:hypothetical protein